MTYNRANGPIGRLRLADGYNALREASLAKQAVIAHERQCVERSRDVENALSHISNDIRTYIGEANAARARLHERADQTQNRISENQIIVSRRFGGLRAGTIRGLFSTLMSLAGAFGEALWYLLTHPLNFRAGKPAKYVSLRT
ncbi:MAG: hypothetical protein VW268_14570 [Rhodospirillaceae bacterium]